MKILNQELSSDIDELKLYVLSDLHIGEALVDQKMLNKFTAEIMADENARVIINGDILNNAIKTSVSDIYSEVLTPKEQLDRTYELLYPLKDKIIAITEGNHERRTYKNCGINLLETVAKMLYPDIETFENVYSTGAFLLYIAFGMNQGREERQTVYSIYGRHGSGGGKKVGSKANKLEDMLNIVNADVFLHSHTHTAMSFKLNSFVVDYRNRKVTEKEHLFVNTNAWLGYGGYGEDYGFRPANRQYPIIYLNGFERDARCLI